MDRHKFRTCQQTSFCRRHRNQHSASLYRYKLLADTVHFHLPVIEKEGDEDVIKEEKNVKAEEADRKGGVWHSIQRRLLGISDANGDSKKQSTSAASLDGKDPYVRGSPPTVTGTLLNEAAANQDKQEHLLWSLSALQDGLLRMRVTEVYGHSGTAYEKARVTYDELVLLPEGLQAAEHATLIRPADSAVQDASHVASGLGLLQKILGTKDQDRLSNYMALQYGDVEDVPGHLLLIQLDPFVVSLYREHDIRNANENSLPDPVVVLGAKDMMHFEVRRFFEDDKNHQNESEDNEAEGQGEGDEKKPEKEIVGYWEDGLAIYADGTREERREDTGEEADHRHLTESELVELDREGLWGESFESHTDSKPYGPMSIGMDVTFPKSKHLYGLPEHASSAVLQTTRGEGAHYSEPYRLYNLDVFEYELDETMALYGHIPLIVSQGIDSGTSGIFWFNPSETFVDIMQTESESSAHLMSESGVMDVFLIPGPDPPSFYRQYTSLTGKSVLPPMFSLGYHQCRWNYKDEADVYYVHGKFEELDYPYDVLWLDIEHTDGKKYFTWDKALFPNPKEMQEKLASQGRRMVTIIDPHIKRDDSYYIHKEATAKGLYIKDKTGKKDYDGWCWPGSSSYLDFTAEHVRSWWADQFAYTKYQGSTPTLFTWNDMNEPSVFNGPEVSMQKDLRNLNGDEHREWHNLYGMLFHQATTEGQVRRNSGHDVRPFVLSRAFFAGSQRVGPIWTGDNTADWGHLEVSSPMLLSLNAAAYSFVGADVGGFFGDPDAELFTRWMQAGAYQPFFRGHAHHDSKRREPWMFDDDTLARLRRCAMERYALLPFWYTVFHHGHTTGMPVMRMMWMQYPQIEALFGIDDQYLIGSDLLVKPVTAAGVSVSTILFPTDDIWYDAESLEIMPTEKRPDHVQALEVDSPIDKIPVFQRGGSIITRKLRLRRSTMLMKTDPYTLYVALDAIGQAVGHLYMDDEETFSYRKHDEFAIANITADFSSGNAYIQNDVSVGSGWEEQVSNLADDRLIERIVILGLKKAPKAVKWNGSDLQFRHEAKTDVVVVRKPDLPAIVGWKLTFQM